MKNWDKILADIAKDLYDGKLNIEHVPQSMIAGFAEKLMSGVELGFIQQQSDINEYTLLQKLRENIFVFSGFKGYNELKEIGSLLTDNNGNIRSFEDFFRDLKTIDDTYSKAYLAAEYNNAIHSGTMMAKWEKFKAEADIYPMLTYRTVNDGRVRAEHKDLEGTTKPIDDPFWNAYYPPNGWNCRCDVEQTDEQEKNPEAYPEIKPMFRNNVGKQGIIFPEHHPYFQTGNEKTKRKIREASIFAMPIEAQWQTLSKYKNGGKVLQHLNVNPDKEDYKRLLKVAQIFAKKGNVVEILPEIHEKNKALRKTILSGFKNNTSNPDFRINGQYWEEESPTLPLTFDKISNRIRQGSKQSNKVIITLASNTFNDDLEKIALHRFRTLEYLNEISFIVAEKIYTFKKT